MRDLFGGSFFSLPVFLPPPQALPYFQVGTQLTIDSVFLVASLKFSYCSWTKTRVCSKIIDSPEVTDVKPWLWSPQGGEWIIEVAIKKPMGMHGANFELDRSGQLLECLFSYCGTDRTSNVRYPFLQLSSPDLFAASPALVCPIIMNVFSSSASVHLKSRQSTTVVSRLTKGK